MNIISEHHPAHRPVTIMAGVLLVMFFAIGLEATYGLVYVNRIYPGVSVNGLTLSGLTREEASKALATFVQERTPDTITVSVEGIQQTLDLSIISPDDPDLSRSLIHTDIDAGIDLAFAQGRNKHPFPSLFLGLLPLLERPHLFTPLALEENTLLERLLMAYPKFDTTPAPTHYLVTQASDAWQISVVEGETRQILDADAFSRQLRLQLNDLTKTQTTPIVVPVLTTTPEVSLEKAVALIPRVETILNSAPYHLVFEDEYQRQQTWELSSETIAHLLLPQPDRLDLDDEGLLTELQLIAGDINKLPQNAHFEAKNGRAAVFVPSQNGRILDQDASRQVVETQILSATADSIPLIIAMAEPDVVLADANDLGIKELLGTGISSYAGSPSNRIKNIQNGVNLLNGLLIPPGETFSLLAALRPFTTANNYLPELVIKGDEIIPEIGGGLCQIGSTTFRATMNAGLPVIARSNHSLVVSYYNDLSNGNPGTDATIYDPAPDYKLQNNTEHYILFEALMNREEQKLYFNFWGTSDGREGSYSPPVVDSWNGSGTPREIETVDLPVGTRKCQLAHPGATTHFTYTIKNPDGTLTERIFTSQYRSLPKVCLVGVEALTPPPDSSIIPPEPPTPISDTEPLS